jgi:hypothetical protein
LEKNYEFRKKMAVIHQPNRRDPQKQAGKSEIEIGEDWNIVINRSSSEYLINLAKDLQDYLFTSMQVSVLLRRVENPSAAVQMNRRIIVLATKEELPHDGENLMETRSYRLKVSDEQVIVCGFDERGTGQGSYYLEDLMNLREAPLLKRQDTCRKPLFSPRMVHSGWGLEEYPNEHLNAIAHAGMDSILVFTKDVNTTPAGFVDFNQLIERASQFGLDVYAYSYIRNYYHPQDANAKGYYESTYGALFDASPGLKGVILVGESCGFPSKDPRTTGELRAAVASQSTGKYEKLQTVKQEDPFSAQSAGALSNSDPERPNPGWWPCTDYPELLTMIRDTVHRRKPDADIVFWTYNWGWAPEKDRVALIGNLPERITLMATFEMFERFRKDGITNYCVDYTITFEGPGNYFASEAAAAKARGIKLYTMSNTGGLTWDIGDIPYVPVPYQWNRRHQEIHKARQNWGLSGLMESHHYGWWPSFVSELAKWSFWGPQESMEKTSRLIAERDYGTKAASLVLQAWEAWSEAFRDFVPAREDQSGPGRIGPSYPLVFQSAVKFPTSEHAMNGSRIFGTNYQPPNNNRQSPGSIRYDIEIRRLSGMAERWQEGIQCLQQALEHMPQRKRRNGEQLLGLGQFILCAVRTTIHAKRWWQLKISLYAEKSAAKSLLILDELERLAMEEVANVQSAIPWVEADSRLGWEPSMEYVADAKHLRWKIRQVEHMIKHELKTYRNSILELTDLEGEVNYP